MLFCPAVRKSLEEYLSGSLALHLKLFAHDLKLSQQTITWHTYKKGVRVPLSGAFTYALYVIGSAVGEFAL